MIGKLNTLESGHFRQIAGTVHQTNQDASVQMTAVNAEEACRELFHRAGHVEIEVVKHHNVRCMQLSCSNRFSDTRSFDTLISDLVEDPSTALKRDGLTLECVKIGCWILSNDNRRFFFVHMS